MTFQEWFYSAPHREKYTADHPAYLAAQESWNAAHEACAKVAFEANHMGNVNLKLLKNRIGNAIRARKDNT